MKRLLIITGVLVMTGSIAADTVHAQDSHFTNEAGIAIGGYDAVAYFTQNEAVRGVEAHASKHDGVTFYFASEEHKKMFESDPIKYAPAYGGYCAFAMAMGNGKVPSDPRTFKLYNGRLYLFFNDYYQGAPFNTIVPWNQDEARLKQQADEKWRKG